MKNDSEANKTKIAQNLLALIMQGGGTVTVEWETRRLMVSPAKLANRLAVQIRENKEGLLRVLAFHCPICSEPTQYRIEKQDGQWLSVITCPKGHEQKQPVFIEEK